MNADLFQSEREPIQVLAGKGEPVSWCTIDHMVVLPLWDDAGRPRSMTDLAVAAARFSRLARQQPEKTFDLSPLSQWNGYPASHLAPLFAAAPANCRFLSAWRAALKPYRDLATYEVRLALVGQADDDMLIDRCLSWLTQRLDQVRLALLAPNAGLLADRSRGWAVGHGIAWFGFPAHWRAVQVPHAEVAHGSVGKRYNRRAGLDRDARLLANATHVVVFGKSSPALESLIQTLALKHRRVRS